MRFERALMLAKFAGDRTQERRATRGLAAAARLQVRCPCRWQPNVFCFCGLPVFVSVDAGQIHAGYCVSERHTERLMSYEAF